MIQWTQQYLPSFESDQTSNQHDDVVVLDTLYTINKLYWLTCIDSRVDPRVNPAVDSTVNSRIETELTQN